MGIKTCILFFLTFCIQSTDVEPPVLKWDAKTKLSWQDFKGQPNALSSAAAITASGLTFGFSVDEVDKKIVDFTSSVEAHFYPDKSWYKPEEADAHILAHEQLHFDITELHARKFRQGISQLKISKTLVRELKALHNAINKDLASYQDTYDAETNFSRDSIKQVEWQQKVTTAIVQLDAYSANP
jgi:hypothetical protein